MKNRHGWVQQFQLWWSPDLPSWFSPRRCCQGPWTCAVHGFKLRHIERRVPSRTVEVTQGERTFLMCSIISLWWFKAPYCLNFCHDYNWDSLRFFALILWILDATLMPHVPLLSGYWKNASLSTLHALHMKSTWFRKDRSWNWPWTPGRIRSQGA